ncbi:ABC transporter permease [Paenibacillus terrigena]|uniref:ABC transporter permease n=1 Tax=Paenibacillus terrigena TaxID=369333 RepID=UPI00037131AA|nr:ABC transporter permease [Paenibacillus terrigena]
MSRKKTDIIIGFIICFVLFFFMTSYYQRDNTLPKLTVELKSTIETDIQMFYSSSYDADWTEANSIHKTYKDMNDWEKLNFEIPKNTKFIRIDFGGKPAKFDVKDISVHGNHSILIPLNEVFKIDKNQLSISSINEQQVKVSSLGEDPYTIFKVDTFITKSMTNINFIQVVIGAAISIILSLICCVIFIYGRDTIIYIKELVNSRALIFKLAKNDFRTKYASSYLGVIWGFIQPIVMILTYWFVFEVGLRAGGVSNVPFILWFIAGIIPWFFYSEAISSSTNVFMEYSYLVKKVVFKIEVLPAVKIVSAFFVHGFFILFLLVIYMIYGYHFQLIHIQLLYYIVCSLVLVLATSIIVSSVVLFFRDLNQIVMIILQIGFWFTPIGWSFEMVPASWLWIFKLNPVFYIVEGFRDTLVHHIYFFEHPYYTLYFWMFCTFLLVVAVKIFKRLKPHFSDVI